MADLLSGLRNNRWLPINEAEKAKSHGYQIALDDVAEALRSDAIKDRLWNAVDDVVTDQIETGTVRRQDIVEAVVAVLAGGDDE